MSTKKFMKENLSFIALFLMLMLGTSVLMTACQPQVNPTSPGIATVTKTPTKVPTVTNTPTMTSTQSAITVNQGDVAFIGAITSSTDEFAFVTLAQIPANAQIFFTNNPWDNTLNSGTGGFVTGGSGRGTITWAPTANVPIYTEIYINATTSGAATVIGASSAAAGFSGTLTLKTGEDQLYCYQGTASTPTTFISALGVFSGANVPTYNQPGSWHTGGSVVSGPPTNGPWGELPNQTGSGLSTGAGTTMVFNSYTNGANLAREWVYQCSDSTASDTKANLLTAINNDSAPVSDYVSGAWVTGNGNAGAVSVLAGNSAGTTFASSNTVFPSTGIPLCTSGYTW